MFNLPTGDCFVYLLLLILVTLILALVGIGVYLRHNGFFILGSLRLACFWQELRIGRRYEIVGLFREQSGLKTYISIGIAKAAIAGVLLYCFGPGMNEWLIHTLPAQFLLQFDQYTLQVLWQVHATVISLSLVGLGFAWESLRDLQTSDDIVAELTREFQSVETLSFLFFSNLLIGLGVLLSEGQHIRSRVSVPVIVLFIGSFWVAANRFWSVFDVLLLNSLDQKVDEFAERWILLDSKRASVDPDEVLVNRVPGFQPSMFAPDLSFMPRHGTKKTKFYGQDIGKAGEINDIHIGKMKQISSMLSADDDGPIEANPIVGRQIDEDTVVLAVDENLDAAMEEKIADLLRSGIRTTGVNQ